MNLFWVPNCRQTNRECSDIVYKKWPRNRKAIDGRHKVTLISKGMLAACNAANILIACVWMTAGRNGNESERYSNGTPADVLFEIVLVLTSVCERISVIVGVCLQSCYRAT